jgi:glycosyltransferase involved in cell wall biosynthesis
MKILHVAYSLGESSAATRLAESQVENHDIYFLLGKPSKYVFVREREISGFPLHIVSLFFRVLEKVLCTLAAIPKDEIFSFGTLSNLQTYLIKKTIKIYNIDQVHLHWGGVGFMPIRAFRDFAVPLIITAHDYHCFTGGCHVPMNCSQFQVGCERCPLTQRTWARRYIKQNMTRNSQLLKSIKLTVIAPSRYAMERIKRVHPDMKIEIVPNSLGSFHALNGQSIDTLLESYHAHRVINNSVATIIVVGVSDTSRQNKGKDVLLQTLTALHNKGIKVKLISIGDYYPINAVSEHLHLRSASSSELMQLYAIADLCIVPSRYETFSQVTLEAIVCGTPVVAFDLTGPSDIIEDGISGFLVEPFDFTAFAKTVERALEHKLKNIELMKVCAIKALKSYSPVVISERHDVVYQRHTLNREAKQPNV